MTKKKVYIKSRRKVIKFAGTNRYHVRDLITGEFMFGLTLKYGPGAERGHGDNEKE
jgi:hypothetical protein